MKLYDAPRGTPLALRLFILERRGLSFDVLIIDTASLENRRPEYLKVNSRGTVPAVQLDNGMVLTEVFAIAEYLDEVATGPSLYGSTPEERAETRMWCRRLDYEVCQPLHEWWRDDPANIDLFLGHRIPCPEARMVTKLRINQALNQVEIDLEGKRWMCGDRYSAADALTFGLLWKTVVAGGADWILHPARKNWMGWWKRMAKRDASTEAVNVFKLGKLIT